MHDAPGARCGSSSRPRASTATGRQAALRRDGHPHPPRRREGLRRRRRRRPGGGRPARPSSPGRRLHRGTTRRCAPATSAAIDLVGQDVGTPVVVGRRRRVLRPGRHPRAQGRGRRPALGRLRARRRHARLLRAEANPDGRAHSRLTTVCPQAWPAATPPLWRPAGQQRGRHAMRVHIGGDHAAYELRTDLVTFLRGQGARGRRPRAPATTTPATTTPCWCCGPPRPSPLTPARSASCSAGPATASRSPPTRCAASAPRCLPPTSWRGWRASTTTPR